MLKLYRTTAILLITALAGSAASQQPASKKPRPAAKKPAAAKKAKPADAAALRRSFAINVIRNAVALPQPDPQDRLRVLATAISVAGPFDAKLARSLSREASQLEAEMIASGQVPSASVMSGGQVPCEAAATFVENVRPEAVSRAEQSLIGALTNCPKQTLELVRLKLDAALEQNVLAPRLTMAVVDFTGHADEWSQSRFARMMSSLPRDAEPARREAPNFAAMYVEIAPKLEKGIARRSGLELLEWLGKINESPERSMGISLTSDAMRSALGDNDYEEALASNVMARQAAQSVVAPAEGEEPEGIEMDEVESVSVLQALTTEGDQTEAIMEKPESLRAREAAAHGFAVGIEGDRQAADRYFDIAFSAADQVWANRTPERDAADVVREVSEAAAHVDPVAALTRAQALQDPSAQAVGMLAVARVVLGQQ